MIRGLTRSRSRASGVRDGCETRKITRRGLLLPTELRSVPVVSR